MADENTGINIRIRTSADTSGAREAERSLQDVREQAEQGAAAAAETSRSLGESSAATAQSGAAASQAAPQIERHREELEQTGEAAAEASAAVEEQAAVVERGGKTARASAEDIKTARTATEKTGDAAKDTARKVDAMGEDFEKGAAAGRVLAEAARGNIFAFGQLGAALKALASLIKTNLVGVLITLGAVAAQVLLPIIKGFLDQKKAADEAAAAIGSTADAIAEIDRAHAENTARAFAEIARRAAEARTEIDAVTAAIIAQVDADEAVAVARINADESLTPLQRAEQLAKTRREAQGRRDTATVNKLAAEEATSAVKVDETQAQAEAARQREARLARMVEQAIARSPAAIRAELAALQEENISRLPYLEMQATDPLATQQQIDDALSEHLERRQRADDLKKELKQTEDGYADRVKAAQKRLLDATEARADAEEEATKAAREAAAQVSANAAQRAILRINAGGRDEAERISLDAQRRAAARDTERQGALDLIGADAASEGTRIAQGLRGSRAAAADPKVKAAADALAAAAQAAREGGTTEAEAEALLAALRGVAEVLAAQKRTSATLRKEIDTLQAQVNALRN